MLHQPNHHQRKEHPRKGTTRTTSPAIQPSAGSESADAASHSSSSEGEDASVRSVAGKPATPVERRAAADDVQLYELAARADAGLADDDNSLGAGSAADNEDANVEAARQAERRRRRQQIGCGAPTSQNTACMLAYPACGLIFDQCVLARGKELEDIICISL